MLYNNKNNNNNNTMSISTQYDDSIGETPLFIIRERINNKNLISDEDEMERQSCNVKNNKSVYFKLLDCCPKLNYYLVMAMVCAILLHNNNLSYFYTDDRLNLNLLGGNWWGNN